MLTLTQATQAHAPHIHHIMTQSFGYEVWELPTIALSLQAGATCTIAQYNTTAVGYILSRTVLDECEIQSLAVHPNHRHHGIARTLIENTETTLIQNGGKHIFLETATDNTPAQTLYQSMGYGVTGTRPNYYHRPDGVFDAVLMGKHF